MLNQMLPYLVPLAFLAIYALASLFNKDVEPLPPRTGRPLPGNGGRPQPQAGPPRRAEPSMRWSPPPTSTPGVRPPVARPVRLDDDIVILESDPPKRPPAPVRPTSAASAPAKRPARGRASSGQASKRPETPPAKTLNAPLATPLAPLVNRPVEFKPLSVPKESLTALETTNKPAPKASEPTAQPILNAAGLVQSADRLRESFILSEILQAPLALRGRRR